MLKKFKLYLYSIIFLKKKQIIYQIFYRLKRNIKSESYLNRYTGFKKLNWFDQISSHSSYKAPFEFKFLNISHNFLDKIDWNESSNHKLWLYNLNYFEFLNQKKISKKQGLFLINDFLKNYKNLIDGKESYPTSLRIINIIKFISKHDISDHLILQMLYEDLTRLFKNIEYHLLGNHLLENAFSLLFGSFYFQDEKLYNKSKKILITELNEQILEDGSHFELSPMYHQIMLFRVLDCIQLIKLNGWKNDDLLNLLEESSSKMLSWLGNVTFNNGDIPMVNDCAFQIAPSTKDLLNYGISLGINKKNIKLSDSGYRMFKNEKYELFMDMGEVGASYQPGHVHSDTFNFVLYANNQPFIVDTGTSTYEKNDQRQLERSTSSHNTITIGDYDQTQVWGGFRVAKRAKIVSLKESLNLFSSSHNGYKNIGVIHNRKFITNKDSINIFDDLNKQEVYEQIAHFHFHPSIKNIIIKDSRVYFKNSNIEISFNGKSVSIEKECYEYAHGFNKTENAVKLKVVFESNLETTIYI